MLLVTFEPNLHGALRPTIAEATREALPGRAVHIWQMEDIQEGEEEGAMGEEWLNLPMLMQQFADKNFAKYQLDIYEAEKKLNRGEMKQTKYDAIRANCKFPLVLMHATGEPATARYIKEHLSRQEDGTMKLKAWIPGWVVVFKVAHFKLTK